jgi:hypothetical protein
VFLSRAFPSDGVGVFRGCQTSSRPAPDNPSAAKTTPTTGDKRVWLEGQGVAHVLGTKVNDTVITAIGLA